MTKAEAINELNYIKESFAKCELSYEALDMAIKALEESQWIPCSETVDIPEGWVFACDERGAEIMGYLSYTYDQWICESEHEIMYDPIAWMSLPEAWRGDAE